MFKSSVWLTCISIKTKPEELCIFLDVTKYLTRSDFMKERSILVCRSENAITVVKKIHQQAEEAWQAAGSWLVTVCHCQGYYCCDETL